MTFISFNIEYFLRSGERKGNQRMIFSGIHCGLAFSSKKFITLMYGKVIPRKLEFKLCFFQELCLVY